jgi:hypothetical protein
MTAHVLCGRLAQTWNTVDSFLNLSKLTRLYSSSSATTTSGLPAWHNTNTTVASALHWIYPLSCPSQNYPDKGYCIFLPNNHTSFKESMALSTTKWYDNTMSVADKSMCVEHGWNDPDSRKLKYLSANLSTTNLTCAGLGLNHSLCRDRQAT